MTDNIPFTKADARKLVDEAIVSAEKAMRNYPQPNYVAAKLGEEAGEVIGAFVKREENRGSDQALRDEVVQLIGLALRLYFEGDRTITAVAPDLSQRGV